MRSLSHSVIGAEIIEESDNTIMIKDLLVSSEFSMVKGVQRIFVITRGMLEDALDSLSDQDQNLANDVIVRDDEVDKLYWMVAKQHNHILRDVIFAERMDITPEASLGHILVARTLERIADHATKFAQNSQNIKDKDRMISDIIEHGRDVLKLLEGSMDAFFNNDTDSPFLMAEKSLELEARGNHLGRKLFDLKASTQTIVALVYLTDSLERIRAYANDIAEIAINHQFAVMDGKDAAPETGK